MRIGNVIKSFENKLRTNASSDTIMVLLFFNRRPKCSNFIQMTSFDRMFNIAETEGS